MKLFRGLLSKDAELDRLESDLAGLNAEGAGLAAEIDRLASLESQIEAGSLLMRAMADTQATRNRLRKLEIQIARTTERRDLVKAPARAERRARLVADYDKAASEFLTAARAAQAGFVAILAARDAVSAAGFNADHQSLPVPPGIAGQPLCASDLLDIFEAALKQLRESRPGRSEQYAPPIIPFVRPHVERMGAGPVTLSHLDQTIAPAPRRALLRETAGDGEQLIHIMRNGVEHYRTSEQLLLGDVVAAPPPVAEGLMRNGAGVPISAEEASSLDGDPARIPATEEQSA